MPGRKDRTPRPVVRAAQDEPGYPAVREHLASRRDVLTFLGASVVTGFFMACAGGKPGSSSYHSFRLPASGELETTLASGELCRFYVNGTHYGDYREDFSAEEQTARDSLAAHTADQLATSDGRQDARRELHLVLGQQIDGLDQLTLTIVEPQS